MKRVLIALILLCFVLSSDLSVSAQRSQNLKRVPKTEKIPVKYNKIQAFSDGNGVYIEWETGLESNNLGFSVYRIGSETKKAVDEKFISGAYLESGESFSSGKKYTFFDFGRRFEFRVLY
jgi:hypothetical protein